MPAPKKEHPKVSVTIRLDPRILKAARKRGKYNKLIQDLLQKELDVDLGE